MIYEKMLSKGFEIFKNDNDNYFNTIYKFIEEIMIFIYEIKDFLCL